MLAPISQHKLAKKFELSRTELEQALQKTRFLEFLNGKLGPEIAKFRSNAQLFIAYSLDCHENEAAAKAMDRAWRTGIYNPLQKLRKHQVQMDSGHLAMSAQFIDAAIGYLCAINDGLRARIDTDSECNLVAQLSLAESFLNQKEINKVAESKKFIDMFAYKILIYIGDLYRYKSSFEFTKLTLPAQLAEHYYRSASLQKYADGMALNQLGFLARQENCGIDSIFFYLACLSHERPVENGLLNLKELLNDRLSNISGAFQQCLFNLRQFIASTTMLVSDQSTAIDYLRRFQKGLTALRPTDWSTIVILRVFALATMLNHIDVDDLQPSHLKEIGSLLNLTLLRVACEHILDNTTKREQTQRVESSDEEDGKGLMHRLLGARLHGSDSENDDEDSIIELERKSTSDSEDEKMESKEDNVEICFDNKEAALALLVVASVYYQIHRDAISIRFEDIVFPINELRKIERAIKTNNFIQGESLPEIFALCYVEPWKSAQSKIIADPEKQNLVRLATIKHWICNLPQENDIVYSDFKWPTTNVVNQKRNKEIINHVTTQTRISKTTLVNGNEEEDVEAIDFVTDNKQIMESVSGKVKSLIIDEHRSSGSPVRSVKQPGSSGENQAIAMKRAFYKSFERDQQAISSDESDTTESESSDDYDDDRLRYRRISRPIEARRTFHSKEAEIRRERAKNMWAKYLVPDSESLMFGNISLDAIIDSESFEIIVARETLVTLDANKSDGIKAREASAWLRDQLNRSSYVRMQANDERLPVGNCSIRMDSEQRAVIELAQYLAILEIPEATSAYGDVDSPTIVSILVGASFGHPTFTKYDDLCRDLDLSNVSVEFVHRYKHRVVTRGPRPHQRKVNPRAIKRDDNAKFEMRSSRPQRRELKDLRKE